MVKRSPLVNIPRLVSRLQSAPDWGPRDGLARERNRFRAPRFSFFPCLKDHRDTLFPPTACTLRLAAETWPDGVSPFLDVDPFVACWAGVFNGSHGNGCRQATFRSLASQVLDSLPQVARNSAWACCSLGRLAELCFSPEMFLADRPMSLSSLYPLLTHRMRHWGQNGVPRWQALYEHRLKPLIWQKLEGRACHLADKTIRALIVLQAISAPCCFGGSLPMGGREKESVAILLDLQEACLGHGLVTWRSDQGIHFVVEEDTSCLTDWLLLSAAATLADQDWDKVISDAIWSALSPLPEVGRERKPSSIWESGHFLKGISETLFPGRQAIVVRAEGSEVTALTFESPLSWLRGKRVQEAACALDGAASRVQWLIWEPAAMEEDAVQSIATCAALSKALRTCSTVGDYPTLGALAVLKHRYLESCPAALRAILGAYLQGQIVGREGIWSGFETAGSLLDIVRQISHMAVP